MVTYEPAAVDELRDLRRAAGTDAAWAFDADVQQIEYYLDALARYYPAFPKPWYPPLTRVPVPGPGRPGGEFYVVRFGRLEVQFALRPRPELGANVTVIGFDRL